MKSLSALLVLSLFFIACSNESNENEVKVETPTEEINPIDTYEERKAEVEKYSALLYADSTSLNVEYATQLLKAYEEYIKHESFYNDSKEIQFKAGELAKALNQPHVAIKHFNGLLDRDPEHEKAPVALFYKAMVIGDMLHEDDLAIKTYQEFIEKYPNHPFVESAKESIKLQGKSLDELVKEFEKKNS